MWGASGHAAWQFSHRLSHFPAMWMPCRHLKWLWMLRAMWTSVDGLDLVSGAVVAVCRWAGGLIYTPMHKPLVLWGWLNPSPVSMRVMALWHNASVGTRCLQSGAAEQSLSFLLAAETVQPPPWGPAPSGDSLWRTVLFYSQWHMCWL